MKLGSKNIDTILCDAVEIESITDRKDYLDVACGEDGMGVIFMAQQTEAEKGISPICAKHPPGRPGKLDLSPFPPGVLISSWNWSEACRSPRSAIKAS